jgi:hypothetical protein
MTEDVYPLQLPHDFHPGHMRQKPLPRGKEQAVVKSRKWGMSEYPYPVTLDWAQRPTTEAWDEITEWTIKHFGLPGIRYRTEVTPQRMTWFFETERDKLLFVVAWGDDTQRSRS